MVRDQVIWSSAREVRRVGTWLGHKWRDVASLSLDVDGHWNLYNIHAFNQRILLCGQSQRHEPLRQYIWMLQVSVY